MLKLLKRNPLRVFSFVYGWLLAKAYVDKSAKALPIVLSYPLMGIKIIKHRNAKITVNGRLIVEKRGAPGAFAGPVIEVHEGAELIINNTVVIGPNSQFIVGCGGKLVFGDQPDATTTSFSYNCKIVANEYVKIGSDCLFSWDVLLMDSAIHHIDGKPANKPVILGNHVWVCARATILKGVEIGSGSIVATGAVVTKPAPAGALIGGNPATVLKTGVSWE